MLIGGLMLGSVVKKQLIEEQVRSSRILRDDIFRCWNNSGVKTRLLTLVKQDQSWKEFWLYASNTKFWCPRLCAIKAFHQFDEQENTESLWNMKFGTAVHSVYQENVLPSLGDKFLGSWKRYVPCDSGLYRLERTSYSNIINDDENRDIVRGWGPRPDGDNWEYEESKVRLPSYRIVVKLDSILRLEDEEVLEIKTEKYGAKDNLDPFLGGKPRDYHYSQINLGMLATGLRKSRFLYHFKGELSFSNSLMEQVILYDEDEILVLKNKALKCVDAVKKCDSFKRENNGFESLDSFNEWLDGNFNRLSECEKKSEGKPKYCIGRNICFPKGYRRKK